MAEASILNSTKKVLGIAADYDAFDVDILMHINAVFSVLNQLGVGPAEGFIVDDASATWHDYYGDDKTWSMLQSYMFVRVKILFDPPSSHFLATAMEKQAEQLEWRINLKRETDLPAVKTTPDPWYPGKPIPFDRLYRQRSLQNIVDGGIEPDPSITIGYIDGDYVLDGGTAG